MSGTADALRRPGPAAPTPGMLAHLPRARAEKGIELHAPASNKASRCRELRRP
jgi:hypothetical protein